MLTAPYTEQALDEAKVSGQSDRSKGMLYVGFRHFISENAAKWLVKRVQPAIAAADAAKYKALLVGQPGHLWLAGPGWRDHIDKMPWLLESVNKGHTTLLGELSDQQLERALQQFMILAAPVMNTSSGVATKNILAMSQGIPLVTTKAGLFGLNITQNGLVQVADTPPQFAESVLNLQRRPALYAQQQHLALLHAQAFFSPSAQEHILHCLFDYKRLAAKENAARDRQAARADGASEASAVALDETQPAREGGADAGGDGAASSEEDDAGDEGEARALPPGTAPLQQQEELQRVDVDDLDVDIPRS